MAESERDLLKTDPNATSTNKTKWKRKSAGSNCCIVGCHTTAAACRGLSFPKIPRAGVSEEQDKWRAALIAKVNRVDRSFNPDKARICSRHFEDGCIKYGPSGQCSGLVMWSIPTRWMPVKSIETPKTVPRPAPTFREPPPVPELVCYWNLQDIRKDLCKVKDPWIVKENSANCIQVGLTLESTWKVVVSLRAETEMNADVRVFGLPAPHLTTNLEKKKLACFLQELHDMVTCEGVTESSLQDLAGPPDGTSQYYRLFQYEVVHGQVTHASTVRSAQCQLLLPSSINRTNICLPCSHVQQLLCARLKRRDAGMLKPISLHDPLHDVQQARLKNAFKQCRHENAKLKQALGTFKKSVQVHSIQLSE